jgi:hypothetical protein
MKKNKILFGTAMLVLAGSLLFTSCRKKDRKEEEPDQETATASDNANMENISSDIDAMGGEAAESGTIVGRGTNVSGISVAPNATVTGYGTSTITIDFGTGISCQDGRVRSGKIIYDLSGSSPATSIYYRNPGFKVVVTSQNYVVDGNAVTIINKTIQNTTPASVGGQTVYTGVDLTWSISSNISVVKANNGGTITWSCSRTKTLINSNDATCYHGQTIPITWAKAKIKLTGNASGTNAKSEGYTVTATDLIRDFNCTPSSIHPNKHPFISGTIDYKPGSRPTRHVDYGNGGCDNNATVTVNGVTYAVELP